MDHKAIPKMPLIPIRAGRFGAESPSTGDSYRDTAQEFALDVVQSYFDADSNRFESWVHDPLYLAGTNTVYTVRNIST